MHVVSPASGARTTSRKWWICGLLLFASAVNYMDRQTRANASVRITTQFNLKDAHYGMIEWSFGWAFAVGSLVFGIIADRVTVRWLYPAILICWSACGYATAYVGSFGGLMLCRSLLGFF